MQEEMQSATKPLRALISDLNQIVAFARRHSRLMQRSIFVSALLGFAYLFVVPPKYTATTSVLIDGAHSQETNAPIIDQNFDTGAIDTQVEVISSDNVALGVIKALDLIEDPEFAERKPLSRILGAIRGFFNVAGWFSSPQLDAKDAELIRQRNVIDALLKNLSVKRVGRTFVLSVSYVSDDPIKAMKIANAFAEAYINEQIKAHNETAKRAAEWLGKRISELKSSSIAADHAVQKFKAENGIVATTTANGTSYMADQQLVEAGTQLSNARGETAKAEARLSQIDYVLRTRKVNAAVTEALGNDVISDLRSKYLRAEKTANELSLKLGPNHYQVMNNRNETMQYERLLLEELARIAETYRADLEVAKAREKSLKDAMYGLIASQSDKNKSMVELRELERESENYKTLYATFLSRYQEAVQRETFPASEARAISPAFPPDRPSSPVPWIVLPVVVILGAATGACIGLYRDSRGRAPQPAQPLRQEVSA